MLNVLLDIVVLLFLNIILSVDNAVLISAVTSNMEKNQRTKAQVIGASLASILRLVFIVLVLLIFTAAGNLPFIYIIGGVLLMIIGIIITNSSHGNESNKKATSIKTAVIIILLGDIMMSFDNAFVIADIVAEIDVQMWAKITLVFVSLIISLAILLFAAGILSELMKKYKWVIYVAGWLLLSVGIEMILKDKIIVDNISFVTDYHLVMTFTSYGLGGIIMYLKWFIFDRKNHMKNDSIKKEA